MDNKDKSSILSTDDGLTVLSLCDGMSGGQIALKQLGINVPTHNLVLRRNNKVFITGNCFSGKDPTKVDRSASYKARQIAIDWLKKHKSTNWCEVQLSYAIGLAKPLAVYVRTDKGDFDCTADYADECTPSQIIKDLKLREQAEIKYYNTAQFGHFGLSSFPWEKVQR